MAYNELPQCSATYIIGIPIDPSGLADGYTLIYDSATNTFYFGDHGDLAGLAADDHVQYALLAGRGTGQTLIGGTAAGNSLTLQSTSNATRGKILFGASSAYDEVNVRLGINTLSPGGNFEALTAATGAISFRHRWTDGSFPSTLDTIQSTTSTGTVGAEFYRIRHIFGGNSNNGYLAFHRGGGLSGGFLSFGSNGAEVMRYDELGNVDIGSGGLAGAKLKVTNTVAGTVATIFKGAVSQTANLTEWQDSTATGLSAITASGALGIGVIAPSELGYFLKAQNAGTSVACENASAGTGAFASVEARNAASISSSFRMLAMGTGYTTAGAFTQNAGVMSAETTLTGGLNLLTRAAAPMRFYTNGHTNERMRIDSAGLVGVGITTPLYKLDVVQATGTAIHFGTASDQGAFFLSTYASQAILSGGASFNGTNWVAKSTEASYIDLEAGVVIFSGDAGLVSGNTFTPTERMRISSIGNVAIGSTANTARFHVTSGVTTTIASVIKGAAAQTANLTEWQNSAATILGSITAAGLAQFPGLGVGVAPVSGRLYVGAAPTTQAYVSQRNTWTNIAATATGVMSETSVVVTSNNANAVNGLLSTIDYSSAFTLTTAVTAAGGYAAAGLIGVKGQCVVSGASAVVVSTAGLAFQGLIRSGSVVTDAIGAIIQPALADVGSATATTVTGLWLKRAGGSLTCTTERAIYIEASTLATNKYAIYSEGGETYLNGPIRFVPGTSVSTVNNGDLVFEFTNNTTVTIKGKGSDGTVRSATITLA